MTQQTAAQPPDAQKNKPPPTRTQQVVALMNKIEPVVKRALPAGLGIDPKRFCQMSMTAVLEDTKGKLLACSDGSLIRAVVKAAELGLQPGSAFGFCYFILYYNRDIGRDECEFQVGTWGYLQLARRSGEVVDAWADVIYEADACRVVSGSERRLEHEPAWQLEPGKPVAEGGRGKCLGAYACAELAGGIKSWQLVPLRDLDQARAASKAKSSPAYKDWEDEMRKKTAIKRAQKYWPKVAELARAIQLEEGGDVRHDLVESIVAKGETVSSSPSRALDAVVEQARGALPEAQPSAVDALSQPPEREPVKATQTPRQADDDPESFGDPDGDFVHRDPQEEDR